MAVITKAMAATDPAVEAMRRNSTKKYGTSMAVTGIDFRLKPGVVTGYLGTNGADKSTRMRMIFWLDCRPLGR